MLENDFVAREVGGATTKWGIMLRIRECGLANQIRLWRPEIRGGGEIWLHLGAISEPYHKPRLYNNLGEPRFGESNWYNFILNKLLRNLDLHRNGHTYKSIGWLLKIFSGAI
jgi:hypothetical protein